MKIVSWNLKNIGQSKLSNKFQPGFTAFGLGNDVLDYVTGLVTGSDRWNNVTDLSTGFADIFVMIELKTGGNQKTKPISGTCIPTLNDVTGRLNLIVSQKYPINPPLHYNYVTPVIVGYHETVGVIFNDKLLQYKGLELFRNKSTGNWINPRSPLGFEFLTNTGNTIRVVGIHAPPPKGSGDVKYKPPIEFCVQLPETSAATNSNVFIMGDFNCNPDSYYVKSGKKIKPFTGLKNFGTFLPNGTLSSVRTKVASGLKPPNNYLNDAYDNIILNATLKNQKEIVADLIGNARDMNKQNHPNVSTTNLVALVNAFNRVSDHLPVVIQFD